MNYLYRHFISVFCKGSISFRRNVVHYLFLDFQSEAYQLYASFMRYCFQSCSSPSQADVVLLSGPSSPGRAFPFGQLMWSDSALFLLWAKHSEFWGSLFIASQAHTFYRMLPSSFQCFTSIKLTFCFYLLATCTLLALFQIAIKLQNFARLFRFAGFFPARHWSIYFQDLIWYY